MIETASRMLRLLALLQARPAWTGAELAERLGVTTRTVRNDIDRLRQLGYGIDADRGPHGSYRLGVGAALPPLLLMDDEAIAVAIGLGQASRAGIADLEEASIRALAKIEQSLPSHLRTRVAALGGAAQVRLDDDAPEADAQILATAGAAQRRHERLHLTYTSHDGRESRRTVEPHHLVSWGRRWYLVAWDASRTDWRTFRVDRISRAQPTGQLFTERPAPENDMGRYIARNVARAGWRIVATYEISAPAGEVLARINEAVGVVEPIDEHRCVLRAGAEDLATSAVYIGMLGLDFRVIDPPELADYLRATAERYLRAV